MVKITDIGAKIMNTDRPLIECRLSWWNFFWHFVFCWLIIPLIIAIWKHAALIIRVYEDRVVIETGVLSKHVKEIFITDIRTIDIKQTFIQRVVNIGDIMLATAGTSSYEIIACGLPNPMDIKKMIITQRQKI